MRRIILALHVTILLLMSGCSPYPVYVDEIDLTYPQLMVGEKAEKPMVIVLDPESVPNYVEVSESGVRTFHLYNVQAFVTQHLVEAFGDYFDSVEIGDVNAEESEGEGITTHVRLDDIAVHKAGESTFYGEITWSLAMKIQGHDDYFFSYAGTSRGSYGMSAVRDSIPGFQSAFSAAVASMLESFVDSESVSMLRQIERESADDGSIDATETQDENDGWL